MGEGERVVEKHECRVELERDKRHVFSAWEEESSERRGGRSRIGFIQRASYPSAQELTTGEKKALSSLEDLHWVPATEWFPMQPGLHLQWTYSDALRGRSSYDLACHRDDVDDDSFLLVCSDCLTNFFFFVFTPDSRFLPPFSYTDPFWHHLCLDAVAAGAPIQYLDISPLGMWGWDQ